MQPQLIYPTSLSNFYSLYSHIHISFHTSMFYIYPTHISLHLITSHTSMSYISMSNINTQQTTYIHYFKHTSNFLSFFKFLDRLAPHQKSDPCPLCVRYSGKQVGASFQEVSFLFLIPLTLVIECPATVWNNVGICTILIDGNMALLTRAKFHGAKIQKCSEINPHNLSISATAAVEVSCRPFCLFLYAT